MRSLYKVLAKTPENPPFSVCGPGLRREGAPGRTQPQVLDKQVENPRNPVIPSINILGVWLNRGQAAATSERRMADIEFQLLVFHPLKIELVETVEFIKYAREALSDRILCDRKTL